MLDKMRIPFFDYPRHFTDDKQEILAIVEDIGSRGAFIMQKDLATFESSLANFCASNFAIGVANATDGLEICLQSIGLNKGDEVICSGHTMLATASAIRMAGGSAVPVDIGEDNLICPDSIEEAITENTVGIMPTQLNGRTCNMDRIMAIASRYNLFVVEDAAQALGSKFKGKSAGTFGVASAISFFPAKTLGCLGDGGAVLTQSEDMYAKLYQMHDHGRDTNGEVRSWGRNSRLDNLNAAILNYKLKNYSKIVNRRREVASLYEKQLAEVDELKLPPAPDSSQDHYDVYQNYEISARNRDGLREHLKKHGIGTLIQWGGKGLNHFEALGLERKLERVDEFFKECVMLPMNTFINDQEINYICSSIKTFYAEQS